MLVLALKILISLKQQQQQNDESLFLPRQCQKNATSFFSNANGKVPHQRGKTPIVSGSAAHNSLSFFLFRVDA